MSKEFAKAPSVWSPKREGEDPRKRDNFTLEAVRGETFFSDEVVNKIVRLLHTPIHEHKSDPEHGFWILRGDYFDLRLDNDIYAPVNQQTISGASVSVESSEKTADLDHMPSRYRYNLEGISRIVGRRDDEEGHVDFYQFPLNYDPHKRNYVPGYGHREPQFSSELNVSSNGEVFHETTIYPPMPLRERLRYQKNKTVFTMGERLKKLRGE